MTEAELLPYVKTALRITSEVYDDEVQALIDYAVADMTRVGVDGEYIAEYPPMVVQAITCYAKAQFGFDNPDADRFTDTYYRIVANLLNSSENIAAKAQAEAEEQEGDGE